MLQIGGMMPVLFFTLLFASCFYAAFRGGTPERVAAAILIAAVAASAVALGTSAHRYMRTEIADMAVDTAMTLAFVALALKAQRYWPIWVSMVQVDIVATHLVMFSAETQPFSYWLMQALWSYPAPILLAIGTVRHRRRLKLYGVDPAWSVPA